MPTSLNFTKNIEPLSYLKFIKNIKRLNNALYDADKSKPLDSIEVNWMGRKTFVLDIANELAHDINGFKNKLSLDKSQGLSVASFANLIFTYFIENCKKEKTTVNVFEILNIKNFLGNMKKFKSNTINDMVSLDNLISSIASSLWNELLIYEPQKSECRHIEALIDLIISKLDQNINGSQIERLKKSRDDLNIILNENGVKTSTQNVINEIIEITKFLSGSDKEYILRNVAMTLNNMNHVDQAIEVANTIQDVEMKKDTLIGMSEYLIEKKKS